MDEHLVGDEVWDIEIGGKTRTGILDIREMWRYRDLLMLFVKRDVVVVYKQTILGPVWFILQPLFTTVIFVVLFGRVAGLSPDGIPQFAFYLIGVTLWGYFSDVLTITSKTFTDNASIFGKVYFPRAIIPVSKLISGFLKFLLQFIFFFVFWCYYVFVTKQITPNFYALLSPVFLLLIILMSLGIGLIISSMTTKYRDLSFLVIFGIQLLMYGTPVAYSMSNVKLGRYMHWIWLNPLTSLFEAFKYGFLGKGIISPFWLTYSVLLTIVFLIGGLIVFNRVEKRFIDTV